MPFRFHFSKSILYMRSKWRHQHCRIQMENTCRSCFQEADINSASVNSVVMMRQLEREVFFWCLFFSELQNLLWFCSFLPFLQWVQYLEILQYSPNTKTLQCFRIAGDALCKVNKNYSFWQMYGNIKTE